MPHKILRGLKVADEAAGTIQAVFSTLNVVDKDGDVTLPGAFTDGEQVRMSAYGHASWNGVLPIGKGTIHEAGDEAIFDGQFFMDTAAGRDTFAVVKQLGDLAEFSYGYDELESSDGVFGDDDRKVHFLRKLKVHEVSPVLLGAGIGTRTLAMKGAGLKLDEHALSVLTEMDALVTRVAEVKALRDTEGKHLGDSTQAALEQFEVCMKRLREVLTSEPAPQPVDQLDLLRELARIEQRRAHTLTR